MRIPFEGILASAAKASFGEAPLLISVWGNDFTLHAASNPLVAQATRRALAVADGLHTDCRRDMRLAQEWGYDAGKPGVVLPGAGGIQPEIFYPPAEDAEREMVVINPRGIRNYVRSDTFFRSIPLILAEHPSARFVCPAMAGESQAAGWVRALGIEAAVHLLPVQSRPQMANLFRQARVAVSPSVHDGTPNTLLEAMACGCYPVAGDIESLREWIRPSENGALFDPDDPQALADAVIEGLRDNSLRQRARGLNTAMIAERATYRRVMASAEDFYRRLREVGQAGTASGT
jgi:glycosyltransferase involved in cell wall biosynthesis